MLPSKNRITSRELHTIKGRIVQNDDFRVVIKDSLSDSPKFTVVVPKRLTASAVARNRLRRLIYNHVATFLQDAQNNLFIIYPKKVTVSLDKLKELII